MPVKKGSTKTKASKPAAKSPTAAKAAKSKVKGTEKAAAKKTAVSPARAAVQAAQNLPAVEAIISTTKRAAQKVGVTEKSVEVAAKALSRKATRLKAEANEQLGKLSSKWASLYKKAKTIQASTYNMKKTYEAKTAINHKILGWGYILNNTNDRLEVLFKDGIKNLISNYKA